MPGEERFHCVAGRESGAIAIMLNPQGDRYLRERRRFNSRFALAIRPQKRAVEAVPRPARVGDIFHGERGQMNRLVTALVAAPDHHAVGPERHPGYRHAELQEPFNLLNRIILVFDKCPRAADF